MAASAKTRKTTKTKKTAIQAVDVIAGPKAIQMVASDLHALADKFSDIEQMNIRELWALSEVLRHVEESVMAFNNAPRFFGEKPYEPNLAGSLLEDIKDTFGWMCQAVIEQIKSIPPNEVDFDLYMEAVLGWETRCGSDLASVTALIAELMKKKTHIHFEAKRAASAERSKLDEAA